jgi:hypothetical protein
MIHAKSGEPCGWTKSSWRFDRLPGVLVLKLRRAEIAKRWMQSFAIVDLVDEAAKIAATFSKVS